MSPAQGPAKQLAVGHNLRVKFEMRIMPLTSAGLYYCQHPRLVCTPIFCKTLRLTSHEYAGALHLPLFLLGAGYRAIDPYVEMGQIIEKTVLDRKLHFLAEILLQA